MSDLKFITRLVDAIESDIAPLTEQAVKEGNKVFGAAILRKSDLSLVIAETNNETENPLWHGEVHCLKRFYELPADTRPDTKDCIFIATHEPCSLCLSAITWTGFDNFYFLFGYGDTKNMFNIPHDLKILDEVFDCKHGEYRRENAFWKSHNIMEMIRSLPEENAAPLIDRVQQLEQSWGNFSTEYQSHKDKEAAHIPLN